MGKFKNRNWRLHNTAPKSQVSENRNVDKNMKFMKCTLHPNSVKNASKLFENVEIPAEVLEHQTSHHNLSESAGVKNQASSKVHLRRREVYTMSPQMARIKAMIKKDEKFQKHKKYGSLADFDSLNDALPSLEELPDLIKRHMDRREHVPSYRPNSLKRLDQEMMDAIATFQAVSNDESYKSDPFKAISLHIKQRMEAEKAE